MTEETKTKTHVHFDGMSWPALSPTLGDVEWRLRYGPAPDMMAASIVAAYAELLTCTREKRQRVVREIRARSGVSR